MSNPLRQSTSAGRCAQRRNRTARLLILGRRMSPRRLPRGSASRQAQNAHDTAGTTHSFVLPPSRQIVRALTNTADPVRLWADSHTDVALPPQALKQNRNRNGRRRLDSLQLSATRPHYSNEDARNRAQFQTGQRLCTKPRLRLSHHAGRSSCALSRIPDRGSLCRQQSRHSVRKIIVTESLTRASDQRPPSKCRRDRGSRIDATGPPTRSCGTAVPSSGRMLCQVPVLVSFLSVD